MRVLMLSWEYPPHIIGGMGKHVMDLAPALVKLGVTRPPITMINATIAAIARRSP